MFNKSDKTSVPASRTVTIIGPGSSIEGNIVFAGFLRVQGSIAGDVACDADPGGTLIVHSAGNVAGTVRVPNVSVSGSVRGPVHASESLEINQGAKVVGDAWYKRIAIRSGGVLEGLLTPTGSLEEARSGAPLPAPVAQADAIVSTDTPTAAAPGSPASSIGWRMPAAGAVLIVAVVAVVWANRTPTGSAMPPVAMTPATPPVTPPQVVATPVAEPAAPPAAPPPAKLAAEAPPPVPVVKEVPVSTATSAPAPQPPAPQPPASPSGKIITVHGMTPEKPATVIFVVARQPVVLFKKERDDAGEGTRIEVARGAKLRVPIAGNDLLRIAEGHDLDMYFQGRKLSSATLRSGAWISFVPESPGPAGAAQ